MKEESLHHRSYRKLDYTNLSLIIITHLLVYAFFVVFVLLFVKQLSLLYSSLAEALLHNRLPGLHLETVDLFYTQIWILTGEGSFPTQVQLVTVGAISLVALLLSYVFSKLSLPLRLIIQVVCVLNILACLFFWFWAKYFPYELFTFSGLYLKTEIGMWLALPLILLFSLAPIPISILPKIGLITFILLYTYIFGFMRYALLLYILHQYSYLWMSFLYFILGAFFDFAFMIAFYSNFLSIVAPNIQKDKRKWRWLYSA